jgi:hypothetical protein
MEGQSPIELSLRDPQLVVVSFNRGQLDAIEPMEFEELESALRSVLEDDWAVGVGYSAKTEVLAEQRIITASDIVHRFSPSTVHLLASALDPGIYIVATAAAGAIIGRKVLETMTEEITKALLRWRPFAENKTKGLTIPIYGPDGQILARVRVPGRDDDESTTNG